MEWFWGKMIVAYGVQWENSYGHVDGPAFEGWSKALKNISPESFRAGLNNLLSDPTLNPNFPPNLIKFLRLCREAPVINGQMYEHRQLPKPLDRTRPGWVSAREKHFNQARDLLGHWDPPKEKDK